MPRSNLIILILEVFHKFNIFYVFNIHIICISEWDETWDTSESQLTPNCFLHPKLGQVEVHDTYMYLRFMFTRNVRFIQFMFTHTTVEHLI